MSKGDFPALRMIVEGGRLVPASAFDQERLDSYRRGAIVMCKLNEEKDRVLVRKWWAIITLVLKQCETPWKTKEEASEAIKLALGIVNLSKTTQNKFMQYPKSLTELDDPEMSEALENMVALLSSLTRVDVETLKKEAANVGPQVTGEAPSSPSSEQAGGDVPHEPPANKIDEERETVRRFAKCAYGEARGKASVDERTGILKTLVSEYAKEVTGDRIKAVESVGVAAVKLARREMTEDDYIAWCERNLKVDQSFFRGET